MKPTLRDEILGWEQTLNADYQGDTDNYCLCVSDMAVTAIPALVAALRERDPQQQAHWNTLFRAQVIWPDAHDRESLTVEMLRTPGYFLRYGRTDYGWRCQLRCLAYWAEEYGDDLEDAFWMAIKTILDSVDAAAGVFLAGGPVPIAQNRPTLAAQPPNPIKAGCTARKGHLVCEREAWHPAAHTSGGVNWYSGDAPGQTEAALRRIEEGAKGKP